MDNEFEFIIKAINDLYNNIWLGDLETARNSAAVAIDEFRKRIDSSELMDTVSKLNKIKQKATKDSKNIQVKNKRLWILDRVSKEAKEAKLDTTKSILGVLWTRLEGLGEAVKFAIDARTQKTLDNRYEKSAIEEQYLRKGEGYRYSMHHLTNAWEIRAMLDRPLQKWDLKELESRLPESSFVEEISKKASSNVFALYSSEMYLQVIRQKRLIKITIYTPRTDNADKRVEKISETIVNSFVQQSVR